MKIVISKPWGFAAPKIMQGFADAFLEMGHDVHIMKAQDFFMVKKAQEEIRKIVEFRPDFVLGYGFSAVIRIENSHFFAAMKIPTVHYFADDPFHPGTKPDLQLVADDRLASICVWDRNYIEPLSESGFTNVHYLPLAANTKVFRKLDPDEYEKIEYKCRISFAGNGDIPGRLPYLAKLTDLGLTVFGDESRWLKHAGHTPVFKAYRGFLRSEEELCALYNTAMINLNITVGQGKTSANFRVFSVTASGGFLLTDYKDDLEDLFDIDSEIVCYRTPEELRRKVAYYLSNPVEMKRIAEAGHRRTLKNHTFVHRAAEILDYIGEKLKPVHTMVKL